MSGLLRRYQRGLRRRLAELEKTGARDDLAADAGRRATVREIAHVLKGSGTSYGYPQITAAAEALEETPDDALAAACSRLAAVIREALKTAPAATELAEESEERALRVLVIDDDSDVRLLAGHALEHDGFEVTAHKGGYQAVTLARRLRPDAVLLDLLMPAPDGLELFARLRAAPETAEIPIIFFTAKSKRSEHERLRARGARGVIVKPFDPLSLASRVRRLIGSPRRGGPPG